MKLRPYQLEIYNGVHYEWRRGANAVLAVAPTGAGKTVLFSNVIKDHVGASCAIAHRQELVSQMSLALAREGIRHKVIGPKSVVKLCVSNHMAELGASYFDPSATVAVAGVDTLVRRGNDLAHWLNSVTLWVTDEAHHLLKGNKWGTAAAMFKNAKGLGVTATPTRADGQGLGADYEGVFDCMVEGPTMRSLIDSGYLTDYTVFAPVTDMQMTAEDISKTTGDYKPASLKKASQKSKIVGDVVGHYQKLAAGKLGVTFATDVETATRIAKEFNDAGVPAEVVSAKTPDADRIAILRRFKARELKQLVNVDLFGEGFDLPAIEVVCMARPTQSFSLFVQQFGRALRLMLGSDPRAGVWGDITDAERLAAISESSKPKAVIIDHVGNILRHGLPDAHREWTLSRRDKRSKSAASDVIPTKSCPECTAVYEAVYPACPECGFHPIPATREGIEQVDGSLVELSPAVLAAMREAVTYADRDPEEVRAEMIAKHAPQVGQMAAVKRQAKALEARGELRDVIAQWAGYRRADGQPDDEIHRRFYFRFGVDILTAQTLNAKESAALAVKINERLTA